MACETFSTSGQGVVVYMDSTCNSVLKPDDDIAQDSIPVQLPEGSIELRDGSLDHPIKLPALQKLTVPSVAALVVRKADGTLAVWNGPNIAGRKRVVLDAGAFVLKNDLGTDLFENTMCTGTCMDIDGLIGYRDVIVQCANAEDFPAVQLIKIPVCYVGQMSEPE